MKFYKKKKKELIGEDELFLQYNELNQEGKSWCI